MINSRDEVLSSVDELVKRLDETPLDKDSYRELYKIVLASVPFLDNVSNSGRVFKKVEGDLGKYYHIELHEGIHSNSLYIDFCGEGIYIFERKLLARQPVRAAKYVYDNGERKTVSVTELDTFAANKEG